MKTLECVLHLTQNQHAAIIRDVFDVINSGSVKHEKSLEVLNIIHDLVS